MTITELKLILTLIFVVPITAGMGFYFFGWPGLIVGPIGSLLPLSVFTGVYNSTLVLLLRSAFALKRQLRSSFGNYKSGTRRREWNELQGRLRIGDRFDAKLVATRDYEFQRDMYLELVAPEFGFPAVARDVAHRYISSQKSVVVEVRGFDSERREIDVEILKVPN